MNRTMLRSKIHRIRVTGCDVEYEGSLTLDPQLMEAAGMVPYERIDVYNIDNAQRFSTYLIEGKTGSGDCCVNGAADTPCLWNCPLSCSLAFSEELKLRTNSFDCLP